MRHRSRIVAAISGLLAGLAPLVGQAAPAVPSPTAPIDPSTAGGVQPPAEEAMPVAVPPSTTPAETLPTAPAPAPAPASSTPAPTPYAGPTTPLTAPPGASTPKPYPTPGAPPAPGQGFDMGGQAMAPLPPPPASLDPGTIRRQPWRGRYWLGLRMGITGPLGGERPGAPAVLSLGGGLDFGWRVNNVLGLGMGISGQVHNRMVFLERDAQTGQEVRRTANGRMLYWDALFARIHLPLKRRFQPYVEIGGGLARLARAEGGRSFGGQVRTALGLEGWVSTNVTLGFAAQYRLNALKDGDRGVVVGHAMQGTFELGIHW